MKKRFGELLSKIKNINLNMGGIKGKFKDIFYKIKTFFKENIKKPYFKVILLIILLAIFFVIAISILSHYKSDETDSEDNEYGFALKCDEVKILDTFTYNSRIFHRPKEGYKFVLLKVSLKNISKDTLYLSDDEFVCTIGDVVQDNITYYAKDYDNLPVTIDPGKKGEGYLAYEVKEDAKKIDLTFNKKTIHIDLK